MTWDNVKACMHYSKQWMEGIAKENSKAAFLHWTKITATIAWSYDVKTRCTFSVSSWKKAVKCYKWSWCNPALTVSVTECVWIYCLFVFYLYEFYRVYCPCKRLRGSIWRHYTEEKKKTYQWGVLFHLNEVVWYVLKLCCCVPFLFFCCFFPSMSKWRGG